MSHREKCVAMVIFYGKLDQNTVGHREARRLLYQSRTLDPLIRVLPFVLKYLHSLIK